MNRTATAEDTLGRVTVERVREIREVVETIRVVYESDEEQLRLPLGDSTTPEPVIDADEAEQLLNEREVRP